MSSFSVIFLSSTLLRKKIILWFFKFFLYMNPQTLFSRFLQDKKTCNNWNLRLLLLHMSLLHLTIWKHANFLGGKLIYNIKRRYGFHYFNVGSCSKNFSVGHMLIRFVYSLDPLKFKIYCFMGLCTFFFFLYFSFEESYIFWIVSITYFLIIYLFCHFRSFNIWICVVTHTHTHRYIYIYIYIICKLWIFWFLSIVIVMDYSFEYNPSFSYISLLFSHIYFVMFQ